MLKRYKAVFFDWDGTAVTSRTAPAEAAVSAMRPLLEKGVKLAIVSGTTLENIAGGRIEAYFTKKQLQNLYLGLGRGAYNYAFRDGVPYVFEHRIPDQNTLLDIHRICFDIHIRLKEQYGLDTDIVFSRPNYCKIDLMADRIRGDRLFMQEDELHMLKTKLKDHGIGRGLGELLEMAVSIGRDYGIGIVPTCDAKYLEVGISSKSDNVDAILGRLSREDGVRAGDCAFWGDEYVGIEETIFGSDSYMYTEQTSAGDFFDVSEVSGLRPEGVEIVGGGVKRFLNFLAEQENQ